MIFVSLTDLWYSFRSEFHDLGRRFQKYFWEFLAVECRRLDVLSVVTVSFDITRTRSIWGECAMVEKPRNQLDRQQGSQRNSLNRSIDEIASRAGTDHVSVLNTASKLGIPASDRTASLPVEDAAKIYAYLLPAPDTPRAKSPKAEKRTHEKISPKAAAGDSAPNTEKRIPLRNPFHLRRERIQPAPRYSSSMRTKPRVTKAQPEAGPMGALIPPKPRRTPRAIPAVSLQPEVSSKGSSGGKTPSRTLDDAHTRGHNNSVSGLPMPQVDSYDPFDSFGLFDDTFFVKSLVDLLRNFSPRDYRSLFLYLGNAIDLDLRVRPALLENHAGITADQLSSPDELRFLRSICSYKYGLFGYPPSARFVARDARQRTPKNISDTIEDVCRLRPMVRGLMTDMAGKRFLAWEVGSEIKRIQTIAFEDLERWARGLLGGSYFRLETKIVEVEKPASETDWETINFMATVAENLRTSVQFVKQRMHTDQTTPRRTELSPTSRNAHMGSSVTVRDHSKLLIPITLEGDQDVYFGLEEDFFESMAATPRKHKVRETYRRAPGTPYDAEKTVHVASHTRGGTIFDDPRAIMPAVSIFGVRRQF